MDYTNIVLRHGLIYTDMICKMALPYTDRFVSDLSLGVSLVLEMFGVFRNKVKK